MLASKRFSLGEATDVLRLTIRIGISTAPTGGRAQNRGRIAWAIWASPARAPRSHMERGNAQDAAPRQIPGLTFKDEKKLDTYCPSSRISKQTYCPTSNFLKLPPLNPIP